MARIVGGSPMGELSGKMGGFVFSRNKSGPYIRQYVVPVNPNTLAQIGSRANFGTAAAAWHNLTNIQKMAWQSYATTTFRPFQGENVGQYSGFNAFVSMFAVVAQAVSKSLNPSDSSDFVFESDGGAITISASNIFSLGAVPPANENPDGLWGSGSPGVGFDIDLVSVSYAAATAQSHLVFNLQPQLEATGPATGIEVGADVTIPASMTDGIGNLVGYTAYISNAVNQAQDFIANPHLINLGYVAHGSTMGGLGLTGLQFDMTLKSGGFLTNAAYQALPAVGEIRRITMYQVSIDGRHKLIGARTCTIG